jgi:hypothetical protein
MTERFTLMQPSDTNAGMLEGGAFKNQAIRLGGFGFFEWLGKATVPSTGAIASLNIRRPPPMKGQSAVSALIIPANTTLTRLAFLPLGEITLGAATGKIKLSATLTNTTYQATSAAASSSVLAVPASEIESSSTGLRSLTGVNIGTSEVTLKIFATDGASAGEAASTMTATTDTDILVYVAGYCRVPFPSSESFLKDPPVIADNRTY